jgi:hypothetical protein
MGAMMDTRHRPRKPPWGRLVLVGVLASIGAWESGRLAAWITSPTYVTFSQPDLGAGQVRVYLGDYPSRDGFIESHGLRDRGGASVPATYLGIVLGALLGWLLAVLNRRRFQRRRAGENRDG